MLIAGIETLRAACCIAGLDKDVTPQERALLDKLAEKVGVGKMSLEAMIDRARKDQNFYKEQFRFIHSDAPNTMKSLLGVAIVDGELSADERVVLQVFADRLGLKPEDFDKLLVAAEKYVALRKTSGTTGDSGEANA